MADWDARKRAKDEALGWADEPIGKKPVMVKPMAANMEKQAGAMNEPRIKNIDDPHAYLGHFANKGVLEEGHNTGAKPIGKHGLSTEMAKSGFRKVPGTAATSVGAATYHGRHFGDEVDRMEADARKDGLKEPKAVTSRRKKREEDFAKNMPKTLLSASTMGAMPMKSTAPRAISDVKLSLKHHKESIANDVKHAKEHMASAAKHKREMATRKKQLAKSRKSD